MYITLKEIREQPEAIQFVKEEFEKKIEKIDALLSDASSFLFTGCGSSHYLGLTGAALMNQHAKANAAPSGEICLSPKQIPNIMPDVIVPISRSGETTETLRAIKYFRGTIPGVKVLSVSCTDGSAIQELSDLSLLSKGGAEDSVVMTKSFSSMLVILQLLSEQKRGKVSLNLKRLSENSRKIIEKNEGQLKKIGCRNDLRRFIFLGTGEYYGLAAEAMLKIKEMALTWSEAYHPLEFRHGPISIADGETLVTFLWPDRGIEEHRTLLEEVRNIGAETLVIGRKEQLKGVDSDHVIHIPSDKTRPSPALYMPAVQLLCYYRSVNLGLNPDRPNNLAKVVKI